jgi:RimJ/RimL family protein N-acetyltransferase
MTLRFGDDDRVATWAARVLGRPTIGGMGAAFVQPFVAVGVEKDGELRGALIFTAFTGPDIELTVAGHHVWTRAVFRWIAAYVFGQLGCCRITATLHANRADHVRIAERVGFVREGYAPDKFGPGNDGVLMGMLKQTCRWM